MHEEIYHLGQYALPEKPFNLIMAGISYCDKSYLIDRTGSPYDHYAIESVIAGSGILETEQNTYVLEPGDTYFLYKGTHHRYFCQTNSWIKKWIVFDGTLVKAFLEAYLLPYPDQLHKFDSSRYIEKILKLIKQKELPYEKIAEEAFLILHKMLMEIKSVRQSTSDNLCEKVKLFIDENIEQPLSLEKIQQKIHYSKNHIITTFKNQYGVTPYTYYAEKKIEIGKEYIINTKMSVESISLRLQFDTPQYFTKCFKKKYGITPIQYRKQQALRQTEENCKKLSSLQSIDSTNNTPIFLNRREKNSSYD